MLEYPDKSRDIFTQRPPAKSLILIDERWAQVLSGNINVDSDTIKFLDDGSVTDVMWDKYSLVEKIDAPLDLFETSTGRELGEQEFSNWATEPSQESARPNKQDIRLFGVYKKIP